MKKCSNCKEKKPLSQFGKRTRYNKSRNEYYETHNSICKKCNNEKGLEYYRKRKAITKYCVYRFIDIWENVIYIGKTETLVTRLSNHFSKSTHLPNSAYKYLDRIEIQLMDSATLMDIKEIYYINKFKPKYNFNHVTNDPIYLIKEFEKDIWVDYEEFRKIIEKENNHKKAIDKVADKTKNIELIYNKISSIFYRTRNGRYLVYVEYIIENSKKQKKQKTFENKEDAEDLVNELKNIYRKLGLFQK